MKKICFVGGGNMAGAMLAGLRKTHPLLDCHIIEPFAEARDKLAALNVTVYPSAVCAAVAGADAVVLAVKPQVLRQVCSELLPCLDGELIVSIAAGVRVRTLTRWLGGHARIVRAMPNTPALIGQGVTGVYAPATLAAADLATAIELLRSTGVVISVENEDMVDAVTAVSGSGPAYVFHWIESMLAAAADLGFDSADARALVLGTLKGATALAEASDESVSALRERVTSKGGTTAAALAVLNEHRVAEAIRDAVRAANDRGAALGDLADRE